MFCQKGSRGEKRSRGCVFGEVWIGVSLPASVSPWCPHPPPQACCSHPCDICSSYATARPPSPPRRPESPPPPVRLPVQMFGSCLRGERRARLMCDETESSEPLGGSGSSSRGGSAPGKMGVRRGGEGWWDSLITISIRG